MTDKGQEDDAATVEKLTIKLPIPFVKGSPVDYQRMNVEQLRLFISFMYKTKYKQGLPRSANTTDSPPSWWPPTVCFNKFLRVRSSSSHKGPSGRQKELSELVRKCYEDSGLETLLALGGAMSDSSSGYHITKWSPRLWKISDKESRSIAYIDKYTRTYDSTRRQRAKFVENDCQENKMDNKVCDDQPAKKEETRKMENEQKQVDYHSCKHCNKNFQLVEFRNEHEAQCIKGPFLETQQSQLNFMNALGMGSSLDGGRAPSSPCTNASSGPSEVSTSRGRYLRKLPKRNQLLTLFKTHPIPISSIRGQKLVEEYGESVEHSYPPQYEKQCKPCSGLPVSEKDFPSNVKRTILKHSDFPHMYMFGRRQRAMHYQELTVGVNRSIWPVLNTCKPAKLILKKLPKTITKDTIVIVRSKSQSYLERKWKAAIAFPKVRLVNFHKHLTEDERSKLRLRSGQGSSSRDLKRRATKRK